MKPPRGCHGYDSGLLNGRHESGTAGNACKCQRWLGRVTDGLGPKMGSQCESLRYSRGRGERAWGDRVDEAGRREFKHVRMRKSITITLNPPYLRIPESGRVAK